MLHMSSLLSVFLVTCAPRSRNVWIRESVPEILRPENRDRSTSQRQREISQRSRRTLSVESERTLSQEETLVVSATMRRNVEKQRDRPLVLQNRRRKAMGYFIRRREPSEAKVRLVKDLEERTQTTSVENARDSWHAPVCQNYKTESGCKFGDKCASYAQRV